MRSQEFITESLDHPYKILRWEKGDYGDVDAIARLDDGTFLSVMFNKGFSQDTKEEAWSVEFYRNNSQEKTGEGDQQRVFATVLSAVETFVSDRVPGAKGKYKPNKVYFSASKEVKPDENQRKALTRARLYDSLVQRYAKALGFRAFRADTGNKVMYELSRIKPVAEHSLNEFAPSGSGGESGRWYTDDQMTDLVGDGWVLDLDLSGDQWGITDDQVPKEYLMREAQAWLTDQGFDVHVLNVKVNDDDCDWFIEGSFNNPRFANNGVAENFADGKKPGRKGLAKRVGVNCKQPVAKLRSIAANSSGEKQRMAHWCANMKSGKK